MIEFTILGCGSSWGVPVIGCKCLVCNSDSHYNKRNRSSALISSGLTNVLIDFGFDIRHQLIKYGISNIDAAILTHDHADHVGGIDELRIFKILHQNTPDLYSDSNTIDVITERYKYLFDSNLLNPRKIDFYSSVQIGDINIEFFKQDHQVMDSLGIKIGNFVYTNDVVKYPEQSKKFLKDADVWVMDCVDYEGTKNHLGLKQVLELYEEFSPKRVYLTNLSHLFDYFDLKTKLPKNIEPAYDGLKLEVG